MGLVQGEYDEMLGIKAVVAGVGGQSSAGTEGAEIAGWRGWQESTCMGSDFGRDEDMRKKGEIRVRVRQSRLNVVRR